MHIINQMIEIGILDLTNIPETGIVVYDAEKVKMETIQQLPLPVGVSFAIPVFGDIRDSIAILSEEDLNKAGWYRKSE